MLSEVDEVDAHSSKTYNNRNGRYVLDFKLAKADLIFFNVSSRDFFVSCA